MLLLSPRKQKNKGKDYGIQVKGIIKKDTPGIGVSQVGFKSEFTFHVPVRPSQVCLCAPVSQLIRPCNIPLSHCTDQQDSEPFRTPEMYFASPAWLKSKRKGQNSV